MGKGSNFLVAGVAVCVLGFSATAGAQLRAYTLTGVTFADGGTATGTIVYDTVAMAATSWNIAISGGNTATFPPITLTPANSTFVGSTGCAPQQTMSFNLNASTRQFRITPTQSLATATTSVPVDVATCAGGSGGVECFNCSPFRLINAGQFDPPTFVPALSAYGLVILGALFAFGAVALLHRRRLA